MSFGYREPHFVVHAEHELTVSGQRQRLQIRAEVVDLSWQNYEKSLPAGFRSRTSRQLNKYIAVEAFDAKGRIVADVLLFYSCGGADRLMADWARLVAEPKVDIDHLEGWTEKVVAHGTGYSRNGLMAMY